MANNFLSFRGGAIQASPFFLIYIYICFLFLAKNPQFPEPVLRRQIDSAIHRAALQCTRQWTISILNRVFLSGCIINYSDVICIVSGLMIIFRVGDCRGRIAGCVSTFFGFLNYVYNHLSKPGFHHMRVSSLMWLKTVDRKLVPENQTLGFRNTWSNWSPFACIHCWTKSLSIKAREKDSYESNWFGQLDSTHILGTQF